MHDLQGRIVSEAEVAHDLGFADVSELRRWRTTQGQRILELEQQLQAARRDVANWQWSIKRMCCVLERVEDMMISLRANGFIPSNGEFDLDKLILAVQVVRGRAVDWKHEVKEWLDDPCLKKS